MGFWQDFFSFTWGGIRKRRRRKRKRRRKRGGKVGSLAMASHSRKMGTLVELLIKEAPTTRAGLTRKGGALGNKVEIIFS